MAASASMRTPTSPASFGAGRPPRAHFISWGSRSPTPAPSIRSRPEDRRTRLDAYDALITRQPGAITGFVSAAPFWDIGTVADYVDTCRALSPGLMIGASVHLHPTASISDSILWDGIDVGAGARLDGCIVTDGVHVPAGASHQRA